MLLPTQEQPPHSNFANIAIIPKKRRASLMGEKMIPCCLCLYFFTSESEYVSMFYWSFVCLVR